jgi:hypothetical protein
MLFWFANVTKYLNFATFWRIYLPAFVWLLRPVVWWRHINMYLTLCVFTCRQTSSQAPNRKCVFFIVFVLSLSKLTSSAQNTHAGTPAPPPWVPTPLSFFTPSRWRTLKQSWEEKVIKHIPVSDNSTGSDSDKFRLCSFGVSHCAHRLVACRLHLQGWRYRQHDSPKR